METKEYYQNLTLEQLPIEFQDRIKRFDGLFLKGKGCTFQSDSLFEYEMGVLRQSMAIVDWFKHKMSELGKTYKELIEFLYPKGCDGYKVFSEDIVPNLPYWDKGNSSNSASMSLRLACEYLDNPKYVVVEHGALANLVGDKGYCDDRSDVKEYLESLLTP